MGIGSGGGLVGPDANTSWIVSDLICTIGHPAVVGELGPVGSVGLNSRKNHKGFLSLCNHKGKGCLSRDFQKENKYFFPENSNSLIASPSLGMRLPAFHA